MLFNSRQLEIFRLLTEVRSFTQAAVQAKVSQSFVSHTIQELEQHLGCRLLDRTNRRVALTPAGEQFLHHVDRILNEMAAAGTALERLKSWGQVQLRIAAPDSVCDVLIPCCLHEIRSRYPHCSIALLAADRHRAVEKLLVGDVDLAVTTGLEPDERFESHPLFCDELVFVMRASHPWARAFPTDGAEISAEPLIGFPRGSHASNQVLDHLRPEGIDPSVLVECNSVAGIRSMVRLGMGVGILARWAVAEDVIRGEFVCRRLGPRPLHRQWGTLVLRTRRLALPQVLLVEEIRRLALSSLSGVTPPVSPGNLEKKSQNDPVPPTTRSSVPVPGEARSGDGMPVAPAAKPGRMGFGRLRQHATTERFP